MATKQEQQRIVITGIGLLGPLGSGVKENWANLMADKTGIKVRTAWGFENLGKEYFGECADPEFLTHFPDISAPHPLRYSQMAMVACKLAIEDARLNRSSWNSSRVGLIINSDMGANAASENYALKLYGKGPDRVSPFEFTKSVSNCAIGDVARYFKITGPSSFIIGENPVAYGYDLLKEGKADTMICGGTDELRERFIWGYSQRNLLLQPNGHETGAELAFESPEKENEKIIIGEGSCFLVLERLESAVERGATIYAELVDYYSSADSECNVYISERNAESLESNIRSLFNRTGVHAADVGLYSASSSMPWQLNRYESAALGNIWGSENLDVAAVKCRTSETFSSAVTTALAVTALSLREGMAPGTGIPAGYFEQLPANIKVAEKTHPISEKGEYALVNSIQLGGNITSVLVKKIVA